MAEETVNHPPHYNTHPSGVECIDVCEHMTFNLGNAFKYGWRYYAKGDAAENLKKMLWYVRREIASGRAWLAGDPSFRHFFGENVMRDRKHIFNRPSPWCESVRHAMAAICDFHSTSAMAERDRLLHKAERCILQAITDEECLSHAEAPAIAGRDQA